MASEVILWLSVGIVFLTSMTIMISGDWRINLGALGFQYLAAFALALHHLPFVMGAAKLITGWMVVALLGMTRLNLPPENESPDEFRASRWFHAALMAIVAFVVAGMSARIESAIPGLGLQVVAGGLLLAGGGMIHLGVTSNLFKIILGLLTLLSGFEIIYAAVESSILVMGLLAVVNLSLGLAGSYLLMAGDVPVEVEDEL